MQGLFSMEERNMDIKERIGEDIYECLSEECSFVIQSMGPEHEEENRRVLRELSQDLAAIIAEARLIALSKFVESYRSNN